MRVDFNGNGLFAEIGNERNKTEERSIDLIKKKDVVQWVILLLGSGAMLMALMQIPCGVLAVFFEEVLSALIKEGAPDCFTIQVTTVAVITVASTVSSVIALLLYRNTEKTKLGFYGYILAICGLVINAIGLAYNVLVLFV